MAHCILIDFFLFSHFFSLYVILYIFLFVFCYLHTFFCIALISIIRFWIYLSVCFCFWNSWLRAIKLMIQHVYAVLFFSVNEWSRGWISQYYTHNCRCPDKYCFKNTIIWSIIPCDDVPSIWIMQQIRCTYKRIVFCHTS